MSQKADMSSLLRSYRKRYMFMSANCTENSETIKEYTRIAGFRQSHGLFRSHLLNGNVLRFYTQLSVHWLIVVCR